MRVSELAKHCDASLDAIGYYGRQRLPSSPARLASGYRRYQVPGIARLRIVRHVKTLGFTLHESVESLALSDHCHEVMGKFKTRAAAEVIDIEAGLAQLPRIRDIRQKMAASFREHDAQASGLCDGRFVAQRLFRLDSRQVPHKRLIAPENALGKSNPRRGGSDSIRCTNFKHTE